MSTPTLTLIATPDPDRVPEARLAVLRDRLALAAQQYGDLLAAVQAALAADAANMPGPLGYLRDALAPEQIPPRGARPAHYLPPGPDESVWGRW